MQKNNNPAILLTGGHGATTGMAIIEGIKQKFPTASIFWIGAKKAISGSKATSMEFKTYPGLGIKSYWINAGKLQTKFTIYTIPHLLLIPVGFMESLILMLKIKPTVIVSLGGYASMPVVFWGWIFRIPIVLHEQTVVAGRAAKVTGFLATKIALGRADSLKYFPSKKCFITGNPLRREILNINPDLKLSDKKTILIMGGSRGSEFINSQINKIVPTLKNNHQILHITGEKDFPLYSSKSDENYTVRAFLDTTEMAEFYKRSDVIISRAGANTVSELIYLKKPAILIPLPKTYMNEQYKNAEYAANLGFIKVIPESQVTAERLLKEINSLFDRWDEITGTAGSYISPDINATDNIVKLVTDFV